MGLLVGVRVLAARVSDNAGGIAVFDLARPRTERLGRVWVDAGFNNAFAAYLRSRRVAVEVVNEIHPAFDPLHSQPRPHSPCAAPGSRRSVRRQDDAQRSSPVRACILATLTVFSRHADRDRA